MYALTLDYRCFENPFVMGQDMNNSQFNRHPEEHQQQIQLQPQQQNHEPAEADLLRKLLAQFRILTPASKNQTHSACIPVETESKPYVSHTDSAHHPFLDALDETYLKPLSSAKKSSMSISDMTDPEQGVHDREVWSAKKRKRRAVVALRHDEEEELMDKEEDATVIIVTILFFFLLTLHD
jgi:hypothetical protein